jgi:hypothetical protein
MEPHADPNRERDHYWWTMYVASRHARELAGRGVAWAAAQEAAKAVRNARLMLAIPKLPAPPIPSCSICLSDDCKRDHVCE